MVTPFRDSICEKNLQFGCMMSGGPPTSNQMTSIYSPVTSAQDQWGSSKDVCSMTPAEDDAEDGRARLGAVGERCHCQQEVWPSPLGPAERGPKTTSTLGLGDEEHAKMFF